MIIVVMAAETIFFSIAKCLGVRRVCKKTYDWLSEHNVLSCVVPDEEALKACIFMAGERGRERVIYLFLFQMNMVSTYLLLVELQ